jgi:hypothetical protein
MGKDASSGPVYVPLDSWIYPAFQRLAALGYVPDLENLAAPWPRSECVVLLKEAEDLSSRHDMKTSSPVMNAEAKKLLADLEQEFAPDIEPGRLQLRLESLYTQFLPITGSPLNDSYHFGQTIKNNFGRPYGAGFNSDSGFSAFGTAGRFSAYFRGELQSASGNPAYSSGTNRLLATLDGVPVENAANRNAVTRFDALEAYVGVHLGDFNITAGKQSTWWGPGRESAFAFSDNAEPLYSVKIAQETPFVLPGIFRYLGHIRTDLMVGRLTGNTSPPKPFINAEKITFQLSRDLEIGFTRSTIFGGVGHPLTAGSIAGSFFSVTSTGGTAFGSRNDPGDRRSGFDFLWRVTGARRYVTLYSDSLADDEPNPLASPRRSAWAPGIYFPRLFNSKLDLRFETYSTWLYRGDQGGLFFYWNNQYRDAYTNNGNIFGSWVGRDARAYTASSTYWRSAKDKIVASYSQIKTGSNFIPGGGTQTDVAVTWQWAFGPEVLANVSSQWERIYLPVLGGPHTDVAVGFGVTITPRGLAFKK